MLAIFKKVGFCWGLKLCRESDDQIVAGRLFHDAGLVIAITSHSISIMLRCVLKGVCQSAAGGADADSGGNGVRRQHVLRKRTFSESVNKSKRVCRQLQRQLHDDLHQL